MSRTVTQKVWHPWGLLAAAIAAVDLYAVRTGRRTLSTAFAEMVRHPVRRWPTTIAWAYLTAHLFSVIPEHSDPLSRLAAVLSPGRE